ncbi:MAG: MMPL family transporter [Alphaproteobacteria bacterium]|nr:MMPL family transporter [Alphaproteobacteria bacterium]
MLIRIIEQVVKASARAALVVVLACIIGAVACGYYAATHLDIDTDTSKLISPELPWRKREAEFDRAFPQNVDLIAIVVDGATPGEAEDASSALAKWASAHPELFKTVRQPDGGPFFAQNGLLFLPTQDVQDIADQLISAQPLLGALAADPSLRGLFSAISLATEGVKRDEIKLSSLDAPLTALADSVEAATAGKPHHLSWENLFTGRAPQPQELRHFVLVQPVLDYSALEPGLKATTAIRAAAQQLGLTPDRGVRVRLTGPVPLSDEEFATVSHGAGGATLLSFGLVAVILFLALRSWRVILAILASLLVGLAATGAFAAVAVGSLNLISVAFAVLFIGIAVDFGIQFSVRYRDERYHVGDLGPAIIRTGRGIGGPLALAAGAASVGFFAFVPTDYSGVSELGLIAGTSMIIALVLNLTFLPAALKLLRPPGEPHPVGFAWAAAIDDFLLRRRLPVMVVAAVVAAACLMLLPHWRFDFDPLNLKDPKTESVSTLFDLMSDPTTTPYSIDVLAPSVAAADELAGKLDKLPEVSQVVTASSYVPDQQKEKLAIISDAALLLGPTLSPEKTAPAPDAAADLAAIATCAKNLREVAGPDAKGPASRLAAALEVVVRGHDETVLRDLDDSIISGLGQRLAAMRMSLTAAPVTLESLPEDLRRAWVTPDGRSRLEVFPKGNARDPETLRRFVAAVRTIAPDATGSPVTIQESGVTVLSAFVDAGWIAIGVITLLLAVILRRFADVVLVLLPLIFAGLLTAATGVLFDLPLNYANIITLPLLLGIGVAFDIYFVMRWRAGEGGPLQSSTARAILFSALTTTTAFGSLALSPHPGTAEMGRLLTITLGYTLLSTLLVLPALLGSPKR